MNLRIKAPEVRVINAEGQAVGVMSSLDALNMAKNSGLDLVEISPSSKPPTCKIMDYGKWKFKAKKKDKQSRKNQIKVVIKEIQLRPRTDEGDLKIKLQKVREFIESGYKVKVNLRFFGREMAHKEQGFGILKNIEKRLEAYAKVEMPAKMERRTLFTILAPLATKPGAKSGAKPAVKPGVKSEAKPAKKPAKPSTPPEKNSNSS